MFGTSEPVHYVRRNPVADTVAFQFTSINQSLPDWFLAVMRMRRARFTESSLEVQHITGKFWSVSKGQYVLLNGLGNVHVMDEDDFQRMYKEA